MIQKPNFKETLLSIKVGESITETKDYYTSFLSIKTNLKRQGLGEWKIKTQFDNSVVIMRVK